MRRWIVGLAAALGLGGCASSLNLPEPSNIPLAAPMPLPVKAQVMLRIAQGDLDRKFSYKLNSISRQETDIQDGRVMAQTARDMLSRAFASVSLNQPQPLPDLIVAASGTAVFDRTSGTFHVSCAMDASRADGMPVARTLNAYASPTAVGLESSLPKVFAQCFKGTLDELLRAPTVARLAKGDLPPVDRAAAEGYLRQQGFLLR